MQSFTFLCTFVQHTENEDTEKRHPDPARPEVVTELEEAGAHQQSVTFLYLVEGCWELRALLCSTFLWDVKKQEGKAASEWHLIQKNGGGVDFFPR